MDGGRVSISADLEDVVAETISIGVTHNYYGAAERPGALHAGVPPMPARFVGREPLIAEVARRLIDGSTRALAADGLPGVGKTTLAVALAYRREVLDHFADGVLWGALGIQPNVMEVLASWASALGEDVSRITDPARRAAAVRSAIGQRGLLLVIDDAWDAESALLLRCGGPGCAHFLTTRDESIARAFADRRGAVEVRELAPGHALELLAELAPEACEADPEAAQGLVAAVGFLPLAVELVGAYLSEAENRYFREQREAALQRMADPAERLRQACTRLGDAHGAEITLRETIRLSLQGLPDEAVAAFHALGAFAPKPETFDLRAATAVTGASAATLSRLLERHLLEEHDGALSLQRTIADAARDATPGDAVRSHAAHCLQRVSEAGEDWRAVEAIYGQVKWSFEHTGDDPTRILEFTAALRKYQSLRGLSEDGLRWNERELRAARAAGDLHREAVALGDHGWLYNQMGERGRALELYEEALRILRAIDDRWNEAVTLNNIGSVHDTMGERDRALELFHQALPIRRAAGDRQGEGVTLGNIGSVYYNLGRHDRALEFYQQALPIHRAIGDRRAEGGTLNNIGTLHDSLGEHDRALEVFQQALSIARAVGDRQGEASILNNIGLVHCKLGARDRALEFYQLALPLQRAVRDRRGEATTLNNIGAIYCHLGEWDRALDCFRQAIATEQAIGDRKAEAVTRSNIAFIHRAEGRLEEAAAELRQVVALDAAVQHPDLESDRRVLTEVEGELADKTRKESSDS